MFGQACVQLSSSSAVRKEQSFPEAQLALLLFGGQLETSPDANSAADAILGNGTLPRWPALYFFRRDRKRVRSGRQ